MTKTSTLDPEAYTQICDTRRLLVAQLVEAPNDFRALFLSDVFAEVDPERDPDLRTHAKRAHALRGELGTTEWFARARELGLDVLLFNLCAGMQHAGFGKVALPVLARHAAKISANPRILALLRAYIHEIGDRKAGAIIEAAIASRAPALVAGRIERAFVPPALLDTHGVVVRFHASDHLAEVRIRGDRRSSGRLVLDPVPGSGHLVYTAHRGGSGYVVDETYRDGAIQSTFCSPWHDGVEASARMEWTRWVAEALASLEGIAPAPDDARPSAKATPQVR